MSLKDPRKIIRALSMSVWRLPYPDDSDSITISFLHSGNFLWTVSGFTPTTKAKQIVTGPEWRGNWQVRATPSKSFASSSGSVRSSVSSFGFGNRQADGEALPGPYLVLNFTDLTKCIANFNLFGIPMNLGDWINNVMELFRDGNYRILDFEPDTMRLEAPGTREVQVWDRANLPMPGPRDDEDEESEG